MVKCKLSREDVAALEVVADAKPAFSNNLVTDHIDLKWILKRKKQQTAATTPSAGSSPNNATPSPTAEKGQDQAANSSGDKTEEKFTYAPPPCPLLTLHSLDASEPPPLGSTLINSPRSAFVILRNGYNVAQLCQVDKQKYFNDGLLDGVTVETVQMRIATENRRRAERLFSLLAEYDNLASQSSMDEVVEAIRHHKYAAVEETDQNVERIRSIPHYVHAGKLDLSVLDGDCVDVLVKSRDKTMGEIRRVLNQRDKILQHEIELERRVREKERKQAEESRRAQEATIAARDERAQEQRKKRIIVQDRVNKLLNDQQILTDQRRAAIVQERRTQEQRAAERKAFDRCAAATLAEARARRRENAKQQEAMMAEERKEVLVEKGELQSRIHARQLQLKKEELVARSLEFNERARRRREFIEKTAAQRKQEQREALDAVLEITEARAREFERQRERRREEKKRTAAERAARGATTRANAEQIKRMRLIELEEEYSRKLRDIEVAQQERLEQLAFENEQAAQIHIEKMQEQQRSVSAFEFRSVGYVNSNHSKTSWLERENLKRETLTRHVRQEREAMARARDRVVSELDQEEIRRKKQEEFVL